MSEPSDLARRYQRLPIPARKLLGVITRQAYAGTLRSKPRGIATMPEVSEACGLDPDEMLPLLHSLADARFIVIDGEYPFEQLKLIGVPAESRVSANGTDLVIWEWPGDGLPILFCHATGLHSRCWDQVITQLPGRHCFAPDFRGHGRSSKTPPFFWRTFGADAAAVAESLSLAGALSVGHSMGGNSAVLAAAAHPAAFSSLLLLDPVIRPKEAYVGPFLGAEFVARRRNQWSSPQEMFESFEHRPPFATWDRQVLRDYCEYGLVPSPNGFELACPPAIEAEIYKNGGLPESNIYAEISAIQIPVQVVRARRPTDPSEFMRGSPTAPDLASHFARGTDLYLPEHSHFIPMEAPALIAKLIGGLIPG
jgi:pimeloyl-ACP methyl ester carboxylesterase